MWGVKNTNRLLFAYSEQSQNGSMICAGTEGYRSNQVAECKDKEWIRSTKRHVAVMDLFNGHISVKREQWYANTTKPKYVHTIIYDLYYLVINQFVMH